MAAVPTSSTIENKLYNSQAGRVLFKEGKSGTINLICPITEKIYGNEIPQKLSITYRDGDGHEGKNSSVSATLRRIRKSDGHVETIKNSAVSSNNANAPNSGPTGWRTHYSNTSGFPQNNINYSWEMSKYFYYVQITLKKLNRVTPLGVLGVALHD